MLIVIVLEDINNYEISKPCSHTEVYSWATASLAGCLQAVTENVQGGVHLGRGEPSFKPSFWVYVDFYCNFRFVLVLMLRKYLVKNKTYQADLCQLLPGN